jgi:nucleoside-diphosphate-sugar epimerase
VIPPVVKATHNVLEAASRHSEIQRVVLTSSSVAVLFPEADKEGVSVDESEFLRQLNLTELAWLISRSDTWNEEAVRAAWDPNSSPQLRGLFCYAASKTEGEKAAWKWVEDNKPGFEFNTVLPEFSVCPLWNVCA